MSDTPASCEVVTEEGSAGKNDTVALVDTSPVPLAKEIDGVLDDEFKDEDNGEASDETSSRRESNSSTDGNEDMDTQQNNEDTTNTDWNELDNTSHTPKKKKKKRRSRRKSRTHTRNLSRHSSAPKILMEQGATSTTNTTNTTNATNTTHNTAEARNCDPDSYNHQGDGTPSNGSTSPELTHTPQHLLDLTPPPTRGRSNAFYVLKGPPQLIHSHSDGAAIIAQNAVLAQAAISPRRNTVGLNIHPPSIPEPSYSGISKPKLINYWRVCPSSLVSSS
jgi:hypothetical protein